MDAATVETKEQREEENNERYSNESSLEENDDDDDDDDEDEDDDEDDDVTLLVFSLWRYSLGRSTSLGPMDPVIRMARRQDHPGPSKASLCKGSSPEGYKTKGAAWQRQIACTGAAYRVAEPP
ncbi:hypothetical protein HZH66_012073 [Vespula vulgaris]|uniref:Uncharacterized protein n=1 Tax=Vespula vulgaris TaxID=7454 RepID=A0A834JD68_VESVU|nr:hypothetical protein HZH66_012073 [Vespula vulgaris]